MLPSCISVAPCPDKLPPCCTDRTGSDKAMQAGDKALSDKLKSSSLQEFIDTVSYWCCCLRGMGAHWLSVLVWVTTMGSSHGRDQATSANISQSFLLLSGITPSCCGFSFNCLMLTGGLIFCSSLQDWRLYHPCLIARGIQILPNLLSVEILNKIS